MSCKRERSLENISKYAPMWWASVTGCAFCKWVKPGINVSVFASMITRSSFKRSFTRTSISSISSLVYSFISRATWSLRLRPVCRRFPASPIRSVKVPSTKEWISSYSESAGITSLPLSRSSLMPSRPATMASLSASVRIPCFANIFTCAMLPLMSWR